MGYKLLGYVVYNGARWYLRKRYGRFVPSRRMLTAGLVVSAIGAIAVFAAQRDSGDSD